MKEVIFLGDSLDRLRDFPQNARLQAGYSLHLIQNGKRANDEKSFSTIGKAVNEIRVRDSDGTFRVIYTAKFADAIYVLHAFQKKTQKTHKSDIELAKQRYNWLISTKKDVK
ncbi:MAG: type II toxin-antitoxin system RelE/ParE family toxin [Cardiobacteriaceae bacterium]|nr:type II toxin-antitoxin system RelE/ParE family toxin [Cardiobacteriaceae bacterium]